MNKSYLDARDEFHSRKISTELSENQINNGFINYDFSQQCLINLRSDSKADK